MPCDCVGVVCDLYVCVDLCWFVFYLNVTMCGACCVRWETELCGYQDPAILLLVFTVFIAAGYELIATSTATPTPTTTTTTTTTIITTTINISIIVSSLQVVHS